MQKVVEELHVNSIRKIKERIRPLMKVELADEVFRKKLRAFPRDDEGFAIVEVTRTPLDRP
jgi:hypothetical protein